MISIDRGETSAVIKSYSTPITDDMSRSMKYAAALSARISDNHRSYRGPRRMVPRSLRQHSRRHEPVQMDQFGAGDGIPPMLAEEVVGGCRLIDDLRSPQCQSIFNDENRTLSTDQR